MPTLTPNTREEQDSAYNPGELHAREQFNGEQIPGYDRKSDGLDDHPVSSGDASGKNIDEARQREEAGNWKNNVSQKDTPTSTAPQTTGFKGVFNQFKKKGPLGLIIGLLLGGGAGILGLLTPGIAIVHFKETLVGDLNDQLAAVDLRTTHVFRAKLKDLGATGSVCTNLVSVRCKFGTMSERQAKKFRAAGFEINDNGKGALTGRQKVGSMTFTDSAGNKIAINNPNDLQRLMRNNLEVNQAVRKAFNPKFESLRDKVAKSVFNKFKTDKSKKVKGNTNEERDKAVNEATAGNKATGGDVVKTETDKDGKERRYILDDDGTTKHFEGDASGEFEKRLDAFNSVSERFNASSTGEKATKNALKSGLKGVSVLGAADTACTVYNTARVVAATAKVTRALALAQFAMVFFNMADEIKAQGSGVVLSDENKLKPEDVEYVGNILTSVDTRQNVVNEESTWSGDSNPEDRVAEEKPNPFYGKNAFDSPGFKTAAYNEAPILSSESQQYMVGGALVGTLSVVLDDIAKVIPGGKSSIRSTCGTIQSWWARSLGFVAGIFAGAFTFGASTLVSVGASVAVGFALPFLESMLADMLAGNVVGADTKGVNAGDASFSGAGALLGGVAMARGMKPLNKAGVKSYTAATNQVKNDYIALETNEARDTPFDIYNQYSFLGSMTRSLYPVADSSSKSISAAFLAAPQLLSTSFNSLFNPNANAAQPFNEERFSRCSDEGYAALGIDADVFCNVRYGLSDEELNMETDVVVDYMLNNKHIGEEGQPASDAYKTWIKECTQRTSPEGGIVGWGEELPDSGDETLSDGSLCMEDSEQNKNFRVYTIDSSINDASDDDGSTADASPPTGSPGTVATSPLGYTSADSRRLAKELADNPNIEWTRSTTDGELLKYAAGETVVNGCGSPMGVSPYLSGTLVELAKKYKIRASNIGFGSERSCETGNYQHPKGNAIDIQYIEIIGGQKTSPGLDYEPGDVDVVNQFATDFLALLPPNSRGGVGQKNCGVNPTFPSGSIALEGAHLFVDSCDHLHIDVRNRVDLNEAAGEK